MDRIRSSLYAVILTANSLVVGGTGISLWNSHQQHELRAEMYTQNIARAVEQNVSTLIARVDLVLDTTIEELERRLATGRMDEASMNAFLSRQEKRVPELEAMRVAAANGDVILGKGLNKAEHPSWADRDYFIYLRDHADASLVMSPPRVGRVAKRVIIGFQRRYNYPDGRFAGVISAPVAIEQFERLLSQFDLGANGTLVIRGADLGLIARHPPLPGHPAGVLGNKGVSRELNELVLSGKDAATYFTPSGADQFARILSYKRSTNPSLIVLAGMSRDDYLASWWWEVYAAAGLVACFALMSLVSGLLLERAWRRRVEATRALEDSQRQLKAVIDTEPECVKVLAPDGSLLQMNRAGLDMIEADSEDQVIGRNIASIVAPVHRDAFLALNDRIMRGESGNLEFEVLGLKGGHRWLETHAVPMRSGEGQITGLLGVTRDITDSKRTHEALKESEERLKEAQRIAHLGNWELDIATATVKCSDEVFAILGLAATKATISREEMQNAIHPDDREGVALAMSASIKNRRPFDIVHRLRATESGAEYVREIGRTIYGEDGSALRVVGTIQDVTLDKLNEAMLRESEERFRTVADFNYDWEYWRGPDREILYLSPSCERISGYAAMEFIADPDLLERIVHPDDRHAMDLHLMGYQDDIEHSLDVRIIRKDGGMRWIAHGCRPVFGKNGEFKGRRVSNRDITERKQAETALMETKERLALALDASALSIWDFDIVNGIVHLDARWARIIGAPVGATAVTVTDLMQGTHESDVDRLAKAATSTANGSNQTFQEEFRYRTAAGDWKWIRCTGRIIARDADGRAVRAIGTNLDITDYKNAEEQIRLLAYYDNLTELPNRRLLLDRLTQALSQAKRFGRALAIMFLDLDNFKTINDTLGHEAGDELLKEVASRLAGSVRVGDTVSRQGGDEFVIVLPEIAQASDAAGVATKIAEALRRPVHVAGQELYVTGSIGISVHPVDGDDDAQELMKKAYIAMYAAKKAGRDTYRFFDEVDAAHGVVQAAAGTTGSAS